jgi:hypothetical protein
VSAPTSKAGKKKNHIMGHVAPTSIDMWFTDVASGFQVWHTFFLDI